MNRPDDAWLDRMYNNRALVPDHGAYFERWARQSDHVRMALPCRLDLSYGEGSREKLDVFRAGGPQAQAGKGAPVMVFIHGGYWRSLGKADHSFVAPAFTSAGACVVVPGYELCPAVTIPQIALQMVNALAWTYRHVEEFGGDPDRITVVGHSAGGHLAAMMMTCLWQRHGHDLPARLVKNALSISGLFELQSVMQTPFLKDSLRLTPADVEKASPAWLPAPSKGVLYSVAGSEESEEFLRHNTLIGKAWGKRAVPVCEALPGLNHFSIVEALIQPGHRLNQLARKLVESTA